MAGEPSFTIPARPQRRYPYSGGVEYEGQTIFVLIPEQSVQNEELMALVDGTLHEGPYRYGDFYNLPMTLYLVRDDQTGDVFRVSIRDGRIRLHVLPATGSEGLRQFFERLDSSAEFDFTIECRTSKGG